MGAGPSALPSAFICAICGSFPARRAGAGPGAFKVVSREFSAPTAVNAYDFAGSRIRTPSTPPQSLPYPWGLMRGA